MIAASRLINALQNYLETELQDPSLEVGVTEPAQLQDQPRAVISLARLENPSKGLGSHRQLRQGALAAVTSLDLANPVLPDNNQINLLSEDRLTLNLFHGGLVDSQGSDTPLQAGDIQVDRNGTPFSLTASTPVADEFSVNAVAGRLVFGQALPADGSLTARYFIGQWERVVHQLQGLLRIDAIAAGNTDTTGLSNRIFDAVAANSIAGLRELTVSSLGPVTTFSQSPTMRVRSIEWWFDYEAVVDLPEASGGIIETVRLLSTKDGEGLEEESIAGQ